MRFRIKLPKWMDEKKEDKSKPSSIGSDSWFEGLSSYQIVKFILAMLLILFIIFMGLQVIHNLNDFLDISSVQTNKSLSHYQNVTTGESSTEKATSVILGMFPIIIVVIIGLIILQVATTFLRGSDIGTF